MWGHVLPCTWALRGDVGSTDGPHWWNYLLLSPKQRVGRSLSFKRVVAVVFVASSSPETGFGKMEALPPTRTPWLGLHLATVHLGVGHC